MCDYCDCRSHPQIAVLSADHERALAATAAIRRALADGGDVGGLVIDLAEELAPHFDREQRGVFERLRTSGIGDDYVAWFERDHDALSALIAAPPTPAAAAQLVALLEDHILREETDMFPAAHQLFAPADWDVIDETVGRPREDAHVLRAAIQPVSTVPHAPHGP